MKRDFGPLPDGQRATLYTISRGNITATVTDLGATLVSLLVPDCQGRYADVVLGFDHVEGYVKSWAFLGTVIGRNANRIRNACFPLNNQLIHLTPFDRTNNLHSGIQFWCKRLWQVVRHEESAITLRLTSPDGDQGFPGNAQVDVTYSIEAPADLKISYRAVSDKDTVFNLTNHSYFNLAGHDCPEHAMEQTLMMPARHFTVCDRHSIPTGELKSVEGTPMDFRCPKPLGQDIDSCSEYLKHQHGYDHNFEVFCNPCAILQDPGSGRTMAVITDCPGVQLYTANGFRGVGKDGVHYSKRGAVCLETQFYPDSVNHPEWQQPFTPAGIPYESETIYRFCW
jgi:aldose 1-epimerase